MHWGEDEESEELRTIKGAKCMKRGAESVTRAGRDVSFVEADGGEKEMNIGVAVWH